MIEKSSAVKAIEGQISILKKLIVANEEDVKRMKETNGGALESIINWSEGRIRAYELALEMFQDAIDDINRISE